jgi:hypothetical protein
MRGLRSFVALLLLAWFPLQAAAAPAFNFICHEEAERGGSGIPMHAGHDTQHADGVPAHGEPDPSHDGGHDDHSPAGHGCCHSFTAASVGLPIGIPDVTPGAAVVAHLPHLSEFFPDQPKRPPLAAL